MQTQILSTSLIHEMVQPLLDTRANLEATNMLSTPGWPSDIDVLCFRGKHFRLVCIRNEKHVQHVNIKQTKMANNQGRKQVIIVKSVICMSVKIVLKNFIPVVKYNICLMLKKKNDWICWKVWLRCSKSSWVLL